MKSSAFWEEDQKALMALSVHKFPGTGPQAKGDVRVRREGAQSCTETRAQSSPSRPPRTRAAAPRPLSRVKQPRFSGTSPALNEATPPGCSHCPQLTAHMASRCLLTTLANYPPLHPRSQAKCAHEEKQVRGCPCCAPPGSLCPQRSSKPLPAPTGPASTHCRTAVRVGKTDAGSPDSLQGSTPWLGTLQSQPPGDPSRQNRGVQQAPLCPSWAPQLPPPSCASLSAPRPARSHPSEDTDTPSRDTQELRTIG